MCISIANFLYLEIVCTLVADSIKSHQGFDQCLCIAYKYSSDLGACVVCRITIEQTFNPKYIFLHLLSCQFVDPTTVLQYFFGEQSMASQHFLRPFGSTLWGSVLLQSLYSYRINSRLRKKSKYSLAYQCFICMED